MHLLKPGLTANRCNVKTTLIPIETLHFPLLHPTTMADSAQKKVLSNTICLDHIFGHLQASRLSETDHTWRLRLANSYLHEHGSAFAHGVIRINIEMSDSQADALYDRVMSNRKCWKHVHSLSITKRDSVVSQKMAQSIGTLHASTRACYNGR